MTNQPFLTFRVQGLLLAVDTDAVRSIAWLPELTVLEEYPPSMAGAFNFHGTIVPVMDLTIRFGHPAERYHLSDRVILLAIPEYSVRGRKCGPRLLGIIAHDVLEVADIREEEIERPPFPGREIEPHPFFVRGAAKVDEKIVMIVDPVKILDFDFTVDESAIGAEGITPESANRSFCPEALPEERAVFQKRALDLRQALDLEDPTAFIPVAVVGLNGECHGIEMKGVREFSKLRDFIPLPCCPEHIVGNMNLRGSVLTLVDIRMLLNMPPVRPTASTKIVVVDTEKIFAGVVVDEIFAVVYLKPKELTPVVSVAGATGEKFFKGTLPYGNRRISLLDLEEILSCERLIVNEEA